MMGRLQAKPQIGIDIMNKFAEILSADGAIDKKPEVSGRNIFMYIVPIKK